MFFYASKVLGFFAIPSNFVILIGIVGALLLRTRFSRARAGGSAIGSLVLLAVIGLSPVGNALIVPLEERFPPWDHGRGAPHGIVVLGGALSPDVSHARNTVALNEAAERLTVMAELGAPLSRRAHHLFRRLGRADLRRSGRRRSSRCGCSRRFGVAARPRHRRGQVAQHGRERAVLARHRAAEAGRALAARHLRLSPAAVGRASSARPDFPVEAYPVDWRTRGTGDVLRPFPTLGRRAAAHRHRDARMGRARWPIGSAGSRRSCFPARSGAANVTGRASITAGHNSRIIAD